MFIEFSNGSEVILLEVKCIKLHETDEGLGFIRLYGVSNEFFEIGYSIEEARLLYNEIKESIANGEKLFPRYHKNRRYIKCGLEAKIGKY